MNQITTILFDFGGTLDTNGVHWSEAYWDGYLSAKVDIPKTQYEKAFVKAGEELLENLINAENTFYDTISLQIQQQLSILNQEKLISIEDIEIFHKLILDSCYKTVLFNIDNARSILQLLNKHYKLGIVSNFYGNMQTVLKEFKIDEFFSVVIDSAVLGIRKPDPEIFLAATRSLQCDPKKTVVIGDSYDRDIMPAKSVGFKTIWLKSRSWKEETRSKDADLIIDNLENLKPIFLKYYQYNS